MGILAETGPFGPDWSLKDVRRAYEDHTPVYDLAENTGGLASLCAVEETGRRSGLSRRCPIISAEKL